MFHPHLLILLIGTCLAEDKWVWSRNNYGINERRDRDRINLDQSQYDNFITYENNRIREYQRQRDREYERERDREQTTRPPSYYNRPAQQNNNEEYDDYDTTSQEEQNNKYGPNRYGQKYPNSVYPYGGYGGLQNLIPNPANGILVGPGGPTGFIGRPNGYQQQLANQAIGDNGLFNYLRPNPVNGILVGPGGPTGIIGRPSSLNGQFGPLVPGGLLGGGGGGGQQGYPGITAPPPQGLGSTGPQLFPGVGAQPQGNGPVGPQVFPGVNNAQIPQRPPPPFGPLFQANPNFVVGGGGGGGGRRPDRGDIYPGIGYPFGYPGGIGGGLYPGGYGLYSGQRQDNRYGFYPSQYYPNGGGIGVNQIPYNNNDIAGDIGYASQYNFGNLGRSNSKKNDNIKLNGEQNDKNIIKKSVNDKLLKF